MAVWGPGAAPAMTVPAAGTEPARRPVRPPHRWWDIVVVPVLAVGLTIVVIAGGILFAEWAGLAPPGEALQIVMPYLDDPVVQGMASIGVYVLLLAALLPLLALRGYSLRQVHFPACNRYAVIAAALFGVALAVLVSYLFDFLPETTLAEIEAAEIWDMPETAIGILTFGIFAVIFAPFVEELYFRGIVLPVLARRFSLPPARCCPAPSFRRSTGICSCCRGSAPGRCSVCSSWSASCLPASRAGPARCMRRSPCMPPTMRR